MDMNGNTSFLTKINRKGIGMPAYWLTFCHRYMNPPYTRFLRIYGVRYYFI